MADEEKLIADAFLQAFKKNAKIPLDLYQRMHHELKIDDNEPLKVNLTMKRGLVLDIEDDSLFRTFLTIGDIVLTINDKVASRPDFKLTDAFKDRGGKTITFTYIRLRNYSAEEPPLEEGERRENYEYKVAVIYCLQRMHFGVVMEGLNNRVFITQIQPKSLGSLCAAVGDVILHVNGKRVMDTAQTMALISDEMETKSYFKVTLERAKTEEARAQVQFAISKESRDPPMPSDLSAYVEKALAQLKGPEPRSIMKLQRLALSAADDGSRVGFHDRMTTDSVIPSDVPDDALIKTPARVPGAAATSPLPQSPQPVPNESAGETSVMKAASVHETDPAKKVPSKNRRSKGSSKGSTKLSGEGPTQSKSKESVAGTSSMMGQSTISTMSTMSSSSPSRASFLEWRHKLSTEIFFGRNRKKSGGTPEAKHKKKKGRKDHSNDTEGHTQ